MIEKTGQFEGWQGCQLHYKAWLPDASPIAAIAIIHGVGEHIERYRKIVDCLVPAGYALIGFDQRGHGRSDGQRGHINTWDEYRQDIRLFLDLVRTLVPGLPLFLYGHSQGSTEVLDFLIYTPQDLAGAIISGTTLHPKDGAPPALVLVAKVMSAVYPKFQMKVPLEGASLSRDPLIARAYDEDPLVHRERSARWGVESLKTLEQIRARAGEIKLPVLILHGEADTIVSVTGAQEIYQKIGSPDKTLHIYQDGRHEPHNDLECPQVVADISKWLEAHLG